MCWRLLGLHWNGRFDVSSLHIKYLFLLKVVHVFDFLEFLFNLGHRISISFFFSLKYIIPRFSLPISFSLILILVDFISFFIHGFSY